MIAHNREQVLYASACYRIILSIKFNNFYRMSKYSSKLYKTFCTWFF